MPRARDPMIDAAIKVWPSLDAFLAEDEPDDSRRQLPASAAAPWRRRRRPLRNARRNNGGPEPDVLACRTDRINRRQHAGAASLLQAEPLAVPATGSVRPSRRCSRRAIEIRRKRYSLTILSSLSVLANLRNRIAGAKELLGLGLVDISAACPCRCAPSCWAGPAPIRNTVASAPVPMIEIPFARFRTCPFAPVPESLAGHSCASRNFVVLTPTATSKDWVSYFVRIVSAKSDSLVARRLEIAKAEGLRHRQIAACPTACSPDRRCPSVPSVSTFLIKNLLSMSSCRPKALSATFNKRRSADQLLSSVDLADIGAEIFLITF